MASGCAVAEEDGALVPLGLELIRKLQNPEVDPEEIAAMAGDAVARGDFAGMLAARDERGRTALHVAATRGDLQICRAMIEAEPALLNEVDRNKNTALMDAAFSGRILIVSEILKHGAGVTQKNRDLMSALQLAVVNEGAGSGSVVEELVRAGADPSAMCWQTTPLMAAADSGHIWALQTLIDLGADPWQENSSGFTALDYARDMETAQLLYDVMQGDRLSEKPAPRFDTQRLFKDAEARRAKLHRAAKEISLEDALAVLEVPADWLPGFSASGDRYNDIRKAWRRICLRCHPDKQPEGLEDEEAAAWTSRFQAAAAAFEAVEAHHRRLHPHEDGEDGVHHFPQEC